MYIFSDRYLSTSYILILKSSKNAIFYKGVKIITINSKKFARNAMGC